MKTAMQRLLAVGVIAFVLAGCGTGQPQEPQPPQENSVLLDITPVEEASPTPLPTPTPEGTEDPDEGLIFDELTLVRTGGVAGETRTVTVLGNGALLINGELVGSVAPETVTALDDQLDAMGFFRLESHYGPNEPRPDTFSYEITVTRNEASGSVTTVDGFIPPSLEQLINDLLALSPAGSPPDPTTDPDTVNGAS